MFNSSFTSPCSCDGQWRIEIITETRSLSFRINCNYLYNEWIQIFNPPEISSYVQSEQQSIFFFFVVVERFEGRFFLSMRPTYSNEWKRGRIWWLHCLFPPRFCYVFYGNTCANTSSSFQPTRNVDITNRNTHTQSIISYIWISSINANIYSHDTVQLHAAPN